jgi:hypothetical protein
MPIDQYTLAMDVPEHERQACDAHHDGRAIQPRAHVLGAPIWPYQASDILLRLLNGPAYYLLDTTVRLDNC